MNSLSHSVIALLCSVGAAQSFAEISPVTLEPTRARVNQAGHIYFNVSSGEKIVTLLQDGQTTPADTGSSQPIWAMLDQKPCADDYGYTTDLYFAVDDPTGGTPLSTRIRLLDYGDIQTDTVVDCIEINWVVAHPDSDLDSDSIVDGVEELAGNWIVWDADNGRAINCCSRLPLVDFLFFNLPGNTPENQAAGALSGWTADVDLVAFGSATNLSFEIGDSDGNCQSAAFCNSAVDYDSDSIPDGPVAGGDRDFDGLPDSDLDGDGLFDWSWTVGFIQPGMGNDFDSDSDTGTLPGSNSDTIGVNFGVPAGMAVDNGDGTWTYDIDESAPASPTGAEDRFAIYEPDGAGGYVYNGGYWFGGFACSGGLISTGGTGYTPLAMFQFVLYGPNTQIFKCGDYNGDMNVNFYDVSAFLQDFNAMDTMADLNSDGSWDFFDVTLFLQVFTAGCP